MKKTKILVATLVASVMLIGAGFASWTDALNIKNTVNTGELKVQFADNCLTPYATTYGGYTYVSPATSVSPDKKTVSVSIKDFYPGARYSVVTKATNEGTIPAKFNDAKVNFVSGNPDLFNSFVVDSFNVYFYDATNPFHPKSVNIPACKLNELEGNLNTKLKAANIQLDPESYCWFGTDTLRESYTMGMDLGTLGQYQELQNQSVVFDIQLNWKQHNVQ